MAHYKAALVVLPSPAPVAGQQAGTAQGGEGMSVVFLMTGNCTLGRTRQDKDGNVIEHKPAQFTADDAGSCVAVGLLDPETM